MRLVCLKRDLRLDDHRPLVDAVARGPVVVVYVYEPSLWADTELDASHHHFVDVALRELDRALRERGGRLVTRVGELPDVFATMYREHPFEAVHAHEETGGAVTYARDIRVAEWCREAGVAFVEVPPAGVVRRLGDRDGWAAKWEARMARPITPAPDRIDAPDVYASDGFVDAATLGVPGTVRSGIVASGEAEAHRVLRSFLDERGVNYRADMSTPVAGWTGCSRLAPHLAWGTISTRRVVRETRAQLERLREARDAGEDVDKRWFGSLSSFDARLHWRCHFMQKLEDEPRLEFENLSRAYDGMRDETIDRERFDAWCAGQTGYPMVDACMRAVEATGWLNFRMRAMIVSFASYHLWMHWREPALWLGRRFTDFEPGIHYAQFQMQSGTTGINTVRVYSPAKQVRDQDPTGVFIRRWVPELEGVPDEYLPEPHTMPALTQQMVGCVIGRDYPAPIVDHRRAYHAARERIFAVRKTDAARAEAARIVEKHGSRKRPRTRRRQG